MSAPAPAAEGPRPGLSVVVPVYRTAWALPELARRVAEAAREAGLDHELVLVDDASPDDAREAAGRLAAADPAVRVIALAENLGQHRAVLAGLAASRGDWVAVMDGDLQDPPEAIPRLLAEARRGFDAVFAARVGSYQPRRRMATSRLFKALLARLCGLPRGAGMYFLASRRLVERLVACPDPRPFLVALVGLAGLPVSAVPVARTERARGESAYTSWGRLAAGLSALAFALRERWRRRGREGARQPEATASAAPGTVRGPALALGWGAVAVLFGYLAGRGRPFDPADEGFRYLLSRAWAEGEPLHELYQLLYVPGQYVYFGSFLRALGGELAVLRLAEAVLGGAAVALVVAAVARVAGPGLTAATGAAAAALTLPGFATVASALVLVLAVDLAARARPPGRGWLLAAGVAAGWLAGWREDSAVLALGVALAAVARRRRPADALRWLAPGVALGFAPWLAAFALRGEALELLAHVGHRLSFLVARLGEPTQTGWRFPADPFGSPRALATALFPLLAALPPLVYAAVLAREGLRRRRSGTVVWPAVAAALVGLAYLPQFLWERPDLAHLRAHVHLLVGVAAVAAASERPAWRRSAGAALLALAALGAGYTAARGPEAAALYPCCRGREIGARLSAPPPPWAGLSRSGEGDLLVLGWGPGWYVLEGTRPPTRFLSPGARDLSRGQVAELVADLAGPRVRWVVAASLGAVPAPAARTLERLYRPVEAWREWRLWERRAAPGRPDGAGGGDQADPGEDQGAGAEGHPGDLLARQQPAEEDRHHRVDEGVGRDRRRVGDADEPGVSREGDQRAEDDEVADGQSRAGRDRARIEPLPLARGRGGRGQQGAAGEHLAGGGGEGALRQPRPPGVDRSGGPARAGEDHERGAAELDPDPLAEGRDQEVDPGEPEGEAEDHPPAGRLAAAPEPVEQDDEERLGRDQQRRGPGGHPLLGHHHAAVAEEEEGGSDPEDRRQVLAPGRGLAAEARPGVEDGPGDQVPAAGHEQRRHGLDGEADGEVGRAPDHVDQGEGDHQAPERGAGVGHGRASSEAASAAAGSGA